MQNETSLFMMHLNMNAVKSILFVGTNVLGLKKKFAGSLGCHFRGSSITLVCYVLYGSVRGFCYKFVDVREFIGKGNQRNPRTLITCQHKHLSHVDLLIMLYRTCSMRELALVNI